MLASQPREHRKVAHRVLAAGGLGPGLRGVGSDSPLRCFATADLYGLRQPPGRRDGGRIGALTRPSRSRRAVPGSLRASFAALFRVGACCATERLLRLPPAYPPSAPDVQGPLEFESLSRKPATKYESVGFYVGPAVR